jgi:1-deoxy-D-xylulose-5-phosphate reductoisomerase
MKKNVAILGSTGSIGKTLINILKKDKKNFNVVLLTSNTNHNDLLKQADLFNVKNLIITNPVSFNLIKKKKFKKKINIYNNFNNLDKIFIKKIDYIMSAISGIAGLEPTCKIIKYSKKIAVANKEAIICGWNIIKKDLKKYKTEFVPVDSEHFSAYFGIKGFSVKEINKIYLTASGGPFLNYPLNKFKRINRTMALKHPNWKMGGKISIDSATMMNKVFEIIEAKNIFDISYKKLSILVHPSSYVHSIINFKNGMTKLIVHDTDMKIPIQNTLNSNFKDMPIFSELNFNRLSNLNFQKVNIKKFPVVKILDKLPVMSSLYETLIVSTNDKLVNLFLNEQIKFLDIQKYLFIILNDKKFKKLKKIKPKNVREIIDLDKYLHTKIMKLIYKQA